MMSWPLCDVDNFGRHSAKKFLSMRMYWCYYRYYSGALKFMLKWIGLDYDLVDWNDLQWIGLAYIACGRRNTKKCVWCIKILDISTVPHKSADGFLKILWLGVFRVLYLCFRLFKLNSTGLTKSKLDCIFHYFKRVTDKSSYLIQLIIEFIRLISLQKGKYCFILTFY